VEGGQHAIWEGKKKRYHFEFADRINGTGHYADISTELQPFTLTDVYTLAFVFVSLSTSVIESMN
jgi:hypothetical protein